jgi:hypothetical protein
MADSPGADRWINILTDLVVPAGALTALLFYFGYASTRAEYRYFGVDIDAVGLNTTDFVMRSPHSLIVPIVLVALLVALGVLGHIAVRRLIDRPNEGARDGRIGVIRRVSSIIAWFGAAIALCGVLLLLAYPWLVEWRAYSLTTPISLIVGITLFAYGRHLRAMTVIAPQTEVDTRARTLLRVLSAVAVAGSAFWATSTIAQWSGTGQGMLRSEHFADLPSVILDTTEPLQWHDPVIAESVLPAVAGQTYRFRYRHIRLLIAGNDRLFLVPDQWSKSGTTFVVPLNDSVRVQFQFQNSG